MRPAARRRPAQLLMLLSVLRSQPGRGGRHLAGWPSLQCSSRCSLAQCWQGACWVSKALLHTRAREPHLNPFLKGMTFLLRTSSTHTNRPRMCSMMLRRCFIFQLDENFPCDVASAYNLSHHHAGQPGAAYGGRGALLHREAEVVCSHSLTVR